MSLAAGARLGPYEVLAQIGVGGMGEVYKATDTNLKRAVAIKVLPALVAGDPDRLARFQREAEVLAALNHPNIAQIHGLEKSDGTIALVMELVEGPTLADRIAQGAIPLDEAVPIAKQIAEALEAAHEQAIIHRDLKPANIKVRADGTVKVLDFGLAKAMEPTAALSPSASMSPTITSPAMMTGVGVLLGTAAYMSPEQARGNAVDRRADIWAFGCVLFEMLTGKRAFHGDDVTETLAAILMREPDWMMLPAATPTAIRTLVQGCLVKDRRHRVTHISVALFVLDKAESLGPPTSLDGAASQARTDAAVSEVRRMLARTARRRLLMTCAATVFVTAIVTTMATRLAVRPAASVPPRLSRLPLVSSEVAALAINGGNPDLTITPDGSRVIYVGNGGTQLFVRSLDALEPLAVFTGTPRDLFMSPDGQWIGFVDNNTVLKKVAVTGGPAVTLAVADAPGGRGVAWGPDDTIVVASRNLITGLMRIGTDGRSTVLTRPDRAKGEADHLWPEWLPGGRAVLFTITAVTGGLDAAQVAVLDVQTGRQTVLVRGGSHAHYVPSGHLVYAAAGALRAVAFDLGRLQTRGSSVAVLPAVVTTDSGGVDAVVAGDGTLAYVVGSAGIATSPRTLVWVDRQGRETLIPAPPRLYAAPRLSPDGTQIALSTHDQERDIWLWNLARATLTRLTLDPAQDENPAWTRDGRRLVFTSDRAGGPNLFIQAADGSGAATQLTQGPLQHIVTGITTDGTRVVFNELTPTRRRDLRLLPLPPTAAPAGQAPGKPMGLPQVEPLLETPFDERGGSVSPDGHWLAYESNNSGRFEVYVRPFPTVGSGQWQISSTGGVQALWARSGRELFYVAPDGTLMTVPVDPRGPTWSAGTAKKLVEGKYYTGANIYTARHYDVSPDGQRFLMIKEGSGTDQVSAPPQIIVVQHFDEELKRLVPTK